jgi:hypothetical protein
MNAQDEFRSHVKNPVMQRRLAKYIALHCFRNSMLQDLHAGIVPSSASGDYSDVEVRSPYGAIAWPQVSRISDAEMKRLMIDMVDRTYRFLHLLFDEHDGLALLGALAERDPKPHWQEPTLETTER